MNEIFKDIPGYEGIYQVSNLGRVRSLNFRRSGNEKIMNTTVGHDGYSRVSLFKNYIRKKYTVHRLIALVFIPNPDNKPCIDHINGNRSDNRVDNLRWCTNKENMNFSLVRKHLSDSLLNHPKKSKPIFQIDKVTGDIINMFPSAMEASRQTGITNRAISRCAKGDKGYSHSGGYIWRYV